MQDDIQSAQTAARRLGLEIIVLKGGSDNEIERAFVIAAEARASAVQVGNDAFLDGRREEIAALGLRHALPTMSLTREAVAAGSLISYGSNRVDVYRQAGIYVGRVLKGEKPADRAGFAANQIRAGRQPQDRQGAGPHSTTHATSPAPTRSSSEASRFNQTARRRCDGMAARGARAAGRAAAAHRMLIHYSQTDREGQARIRSVPRTRFKRLAGRTAQRADRVSLERRRRRP
jgi:hypothetical protein